MSRAAERILTKSIADIEAGNWCQKELGAIQHADGNVLDYFDEYNVEYHGVPTKTMACAVGLLSLYGDKGLETVSFEFEGKQYSFTTNLKYPTLKSPKPIRDCVDALYDALPTKARRELIAEARNDGDEFFDEWNEETRSYVQVPTSAFNTIQKQQIIVRYNDRESTTQKIASKWFRKALALVQAQNAEQAAQRTTKTTTTTIKNLKTVLKGA